jgi:hypothetical protein
MKGDFRQTGSPLQGVEVPSQPSRMEGITKLVNEDILRQGKLLALLGLRDHGVTRISENIRGPAVEVKDPPARPALGIVLDHLMTSSRSR